MTIVVAVTIVFWYVKHFGHLNNMRNHISESTQNGFVSVVWASTSLADGKCDVNQVLD